MLVRVDKDRRGSRLRGLIGVFSKTMHPLNEGPLERAGKFQMWIRLYLSRVGWGQ